VTVTLRRDVLKTLAVAPLASEALAPQAPPAPPATPAPAPAPPAALSGDEAVAEALTEAVKRQFGAHLDASELEAVQKEIARSLESARRLRTTARLGNADEPATLFEARPPAPKKGGRR
jgi:hypothetical protein